MLVVVAVSAFALAPLRHGSVRSLRGGTSSKPVEVPVVFAEPQSILAEPESLPEGPSVGLVAFLWLNTILLVPFGLVGHWLGLNVWGSKFAVDANAWCLGIAFTAAWVSVSALPLEKWFPRRLGFMRDVQAHTELFTATTFGANRGTWRRTSKVVFASALLSASAGAFEELAFRGAAQQAMAGLFGFLLPGTAATVLAIATVATVFGSLHDYCPGYALLATIAGAFFGTVYALTRNLFVAALTHALVDFVAFMVGYHVLVSATPEYKRKLARRDFQITNAMRGIRKSIDEAWLPRLSEDFSFFFKTFFPPRHHHHQSSSSPPDVYPPTPPRGTFALGAGRSPPPLPPMPPSPLQPYFSPLAEAKSHNQDGPACHHHQTKMDPSAAAAAAAAGRTENNDDNNNENDDQPKHHPSSSSSSS
ncbi:hypothetical protein CTAYLR_000925 [Chrysophaeum taylorii]|uniref:CAAX prenyl protease 2/Lysostaphin resistance protein A-like domain-containing protein n=1 Tax=Chrysophaeum taylorii TaxID=2483200 RepID=A0AAD7XLF6_9STRA|nr:hypothetical protein CTAYLR_000925 [Chrysophaeum taylorii]